ncbi:MAG: hypothetical protein PHH26_05230 [Candidatus Thermoplasmatota archaeon]|nr:hypothetical protein [Candidatus Thermoplasmatota archaeon]
MASTIHSKGEYRLEEFDAGEAGIYPGMLIKLNSDGDVIKHDEEGGRGLAMFAAEDALQGNTVSTEYASGARVTCYLPSKGSEVHALIENGQDISIGEQLISASNGKLKSINDLESGKTVFQVIAVAAEACDLTGSNSSDTLSRVIIL